MNLNLSREEWQQITAKLKEPFKPEQVSWRVQGRAQGNQAQVLAYIDARNVMDRLDEVCGGENWVYDWEPVVVEGGQVKVAKGKLSLFGSAPKCDIGDSGSIEANKSAISDALKRAAVHWGVGRYLYELEAETVTLVNGKIPDKEVKRLQALLTGEKLPEHAQQTQQQPKAQQPSAAAQETTQQACARRAKALDMQEDTFKKAVKIATGKARDFTEGDWKQVARLIGSIERIAPFGYRGNAWLTIFAQAADKDEATLLQGLKPDDWKAIEQRVHLLEQSTKKPTPISPNVQVGEPA